MNKSLKIVIIAAAVLLMVCVLAGCGDKGTDTPWEWAQSLEDGDIESAEFWCDKEYYEQNAIADSDAKPKGDIEEVTSDVSFDDVKSELNSKELQKLTINLYRLEESNFTEKTDNSETDSLYGIKFTMADGTEYNLNQSDADEGALELRYGDKLWVIDSVKLNAFFEMLLTGQDVDGADNFTSAANLIASGSDLTDPEYGFVTYSDLVE